MRTHDAGSTVKGGFYANTRTWELSLVQGRRGPVGPGVLPEAGSFVRVPVPLLLTLAPTLGALLVIFLPFIGFALLGQAIWQKLAARRVAPPAPERLKA